MVQLYAPGPYGPGLCMILKNLLWQICSRTIFEKHTAPGAYRKHAPAPGAVCKYGPGVYLTQKFVQMTNGPGPYGPGVYSSGPFGPRP